jgi:hypothetical protein
MVLVLATSLAMTWAGWIYHSRRETFRLMADHHLGEMAAMASIAQSNGHTADIFEGKAPRDRLTAFLMPVEDTRFLREAEAEYARRADYHAELSRKYRDAAARPWLSVTPDPVAP